MHSLDLAVIVKTASVVIQHACRLCGEAHRKGGYLCIADHTGHLHAVFLVGEVPDDKKQVKYFNLCREKAVRLAHHKSHSSSWQSRNPEQNKWGGAIRVHGLILSFSGLPELYDEAAMLALACHANCRLISQETRDRIAAISHNPHVEKLVAATVELTCSFP